MASRLALAVAVFLIAGCDRRPYPSIVYYDMQGIYPRSAGELNGYGGVVNMNWRIW